MYKYLLVLEFVVQLTNEIHENSYHTKFNGFTVYGSLLHVPRWSVRLTGTIADSLRISCMCSNGLNTVADCLGVTCRCPSGLKDCLAMSQTV
ncbi:hypothetical protein DPMN_075206 [Dreissena polymorpha]|uniref:Uncharacterized protein n=1 Tax=Dreissena polymorpha TaxID=45954 RepID=A0A9D4BLC0_DREPO|nr:hypothetical protein DPMN_075206 [Dreissena polymorpha]